MIYVRSFYLNHINMRTFMTRVSFFRLSDIFLLLYCSQVIRINWMRNYFEYIFKVHSLGFIIKMNTMHTVH